MCLILCLRDLQELAQVNGVGERKLNRYGRVFLEVLHGGSAETAAETAGG